MSDGETRWVERWLSTCADLADLRASNPMMDAVIDEIDGRMIRIGDRWLADFASCNYLGFDLERGDHRRGRPALARVGHASELVAAPREPGAVRADRDASDRAPRLRGLARSADDHAHPLLGDPGARGLGHDLPRLPRPQDHLRRVRDRPRARRDRPALPRGRSRRPRGAAAPGSIAGAAWCAWTASTA